MDLAAKLKEFSESHDNTEPINRNSKVLLVDGFNSYLRCFAATPTMNDNGDHVGGMTGFLRSIGMAIRQFRPSRCIIIFDGKGGSQRRRAIFKEYKENRKSMTKLNRTYDFQTIDEEISSQKQQLQLLIKALTLLPVTIVAPDNVEADDVLAYYANLVAERDGNAIIMSTDQDFLQLVSPNIKIWNPIKKKIYNEEAVLTEYGIHPRNFIILRAVVGDTSDNIPGIKGIGPATLKKNFPELSNAELISMEQILQKSKTITSKACKSIVDNEDVLIRNMSLMRLDEQQMSGNTRSKILSQFDDDIPILNKLGLTQLFVHSRLLGAFPNLDDWLQQTFTSLIRFSNKD